MLSVNIYIVSSALWGILTYFFVCASINQKILQQNWILWLGRKTSATVVRVSDSCRGEILITSVSLKFLNEWIMQILYHLQKHFLIIGCCNVTCPRSWAVIGRHQRSLSSWAVIGGEVLTMTDTGGGGGGGVGSEVSFTWNPKHLEIRTRTVEKTLEPLVMQVSQKLK